MNKLSFNRAVNSIRHSSVTLKSIHKKLSPVKFNWYIWVEPACCMKLNLSLKSILRNHNPVWYSFLFASFFFFHTPAYTQSQLPSVNLAELKKYKIFENPPVAFVPVTMDVAKNYAAISNSFKPFTNLTIPAGKVTSKVITRFQLVNSGTDSISCYFFPGFFFSNVLLYKIEKDNRVTAIPSVAPAHKDSASFRLITLPAHDSITVLAECYQVKTYTNLIRPRIIQEEYITACILELQGAKKGEAVFTYVFCGLLIMMVLFSLANFLQGRSREFLYYAVYAFCLGLMLFTKQYYFNRSNHRNFFFEEYLDFLLQGIGICFFMAFMIRFLETRKKFPFLYKLYSGGIGFLITILTLYTYLHYGTDNYFLEQLLENYLSKVVLLLMVVIFLAYAARKRSNKLFRYLFRGNLLFFIFSMASLSIVIKPDLPRPPGIFGSSLVLYETGLLLELIFFLVALIYKNRIVLIEKVMESERLKLENERKELEKQMAVMAAQQEERERISADMHDELGSGMTTIRLMSEIAKNKMKENVPVEIEKISSSANDLLNKMNAIIWSMNSSNDTVDNLISYIRAYAIEYMDGTSIHCKINTPATIPHLEISGDKRRNIFLCLKETLNNALKHSKATEMNIDIVVNHKLLIKISDNGTGIDPEKTKQFGNGLKNIARRMKNIGGTCTINNTGGTETRIELPL